MSNLEQSSEEIWKDINGYEGYYQISNMGNVRALTRYIKNGEGKERLQIGAPLKLRPNLDGYLLVGLTRDHNYKAFAVHRLVAKYFIPNPQNLPEVNHKFGVKTDNRATELEWTTRSKNIKHAYDTGLKVAKVKRGESHVGCKLSDMQMSEIRQLLKENASHVALGKRYNVSRSLITQISLGKRRVAL